MQNVLCKVFLNVHVSLIKVWSSFFREDRLIERGIYNYPPLASQHELFWALSKALDLGKGERIQLDVENAIGNHLDRNQLLRMAGKLAAGEREDLRGEMKDADMGSAWLLG